MTIHEYLVHISILKLIPQGSYKNFSDKKDCELKILRDLA